MTNINLQIIDLSKKVDNVHNKLSELGKLIESLARLEERIANQKDDVDGFGKRLNNFDKRMQGIEIKLAINTSQGTATSRWVERIVMFVVIAALGAFNLFKEK